MGNSLSTKEMQKKVRADLSLVRDQSLHSAEMYHSVQAQRVAKKNLIISSCSQFVAELYEMSDVRKQHSRAI